MEERQSFSCSLILGAACLLMLAGCASLRSDFEPVGEEALFNEDFRGDLFAWQIETRHPGSYQQVKVEDKPFFRFLDMGGAYLSKSLVTDFRMEFEARLEAPLEYEIATAMINFGNYFNPTPKNPPVISLTRRADQPACAR